MSEEVACAGAWAASAVTMTVLAKAAAINSLRIFVSLLLRSIADWSAVFPPRLGGGTTRSLVQRSSVCRLIGAALNFELLPRFIKRGS